MDMQPVAKRIRAEGAATAAEQYVAAAVGPPVVPGRKLCSVCGYEGSYTCARCGARYCGRTCLGSHKETRCVKFGM
jgi:zinc finger HIT domain-containing protein 1